jgi:hypothetical protein
MPCPQTQRKLNYKFTSRRVRRWTPLLKKMILDKCAASPDTTTAVLEHFNLTWQEFREWQRKFSEAGVDGLKARFR